MQAFGMRYTPPDGPTEELLAELRPQLDGLQRELLAGEKADEIRCEGELLIDGDTAFWRWQIAVEDDTGALIILVSHPILPTGLAWTPDVEAEPNVWALEELSELLAPLERLLGVGTPGFLDLG